MLTTGIYHVYLDPNLSIFKLKTTISENFSVAHTCYITVDCVFGTLGFAQSMNYRSVLLTHATIKFLGLLKGLPISFTANSYQKLSYNNFFENPKIFPK